MDSTSSSGRCDWRTWTQLAQCLLLHYITTNYSRALNAEVAMGLVCKKKQTNNPLSWILTLWKPLVLLLGGIPVPSVQYNNICVLACVSDGSAVWFAPYGSHNPQCWADTNIWSMNSPLCSFQSWRSGWGHRCTSLGCWWCHCTPFGSDPPG